MSGRRNCILDAITATFGCGASCRRPRNSAVHQPRPKQGKSQPRRNRRHHHNYNTSSTSWDNATTTTTFSSTVDTPPRSDAESDVHNMRTVHGFGKIGGASVAVEKESNDPYIDFRQSMLQMILEREIYSKEDLKELLNCFLQLNSPYYHGIIVRAFTEIWNGVHSGYGSGSYGNPPHDVHGIWVARGY